MIVIGVDPSLTTTGCARLDLAFGAEGQTVPVRWETWRKHVTKPAEVTVNTMRRRIRMMVAGVLEHVPEFVDLTVIEGPAMASRFAGLADERAGLRWMLIDQLLARGDVMIVPPKTRALVAADNGNAGKAEVLAAVRARHSHHLHVADDNVADAITLAEIGAHRLGLRWDLSDKQEKTLAKLAGH